jgi:hypothetical protein
MGPRVRATAIGWAVLVGALAVWPLRADTEQRSARDVLNVLSPVGDRTTVLVLGTMHLSQARSKWRPDVLEKLIAALERFRPDVIAVERMPPSVTDGMMLLDGRHRQVAAMMAKATVTYGGRAQQHLGVTRLEAESRARSLLARVPAEHGAGLTRLREELALTLLAAYDEPSAVLQWSLVPSAQRGRAASVPDDIATHLATAVDGANEIASIAAAVGRRVGLQRLAGMDDHNDAAITLEFWDDFAREIDAAPATAALKADTFYAEASRRFDAAYASGDLFPHYQWLNSAAFTQGDVDRQFGLYLRTRLASGLDRARLAQWEVRNMRMAAHIREASARRPGGRVLAVVGVAHKLFLDQYLRQFADVQVVGFDTLQP